MLTFRRALVRLAGSVRLLDGRCALLAGIASCPLGARLPLDDGSVRGGWTASGRAGVWMGLPCRGLGVARVARVRGA